jgi:hypothetical protein
MAQRRFRLLIDHGLGDFGHVSSVVVERPEAGSVVEAGLQAGDLAPAAASS